MKTSSWSKEYKNFLIKEMFPLLGIPQDNNVIDVENESISFEKIVNQEKEYIYFGTPDGEPVFKLLYPRGLTEENLKLARNVIQYFFKVSKHRPNSSSIKIDYYSKIQQNTNYQMAIQAGICDWIIGKKSENVEKLFNLLERWSVQTYEGRKVTFGFIINPDSHSSFGDEYGTWCDFLNDDFSAVLTDCIHSVIELDSDCNFVQYISLTQHDRFEFYDLKNCLPFRFAGIIQKYVKNKSVGVFLLNNGDIIISKNQSICFVKRNLKWLNFNFNAFAMSIESFCSTQHVSPELVKSVFASILDVSFAHTGGIIAIVKDVKKLTAVSDGEYPVLSPCDFLLDNKGLREVEQDVKNSHMGNRMGVQEIQKRVLKRKVLDSLVQQQPFEKLDRKLRCELISMDGACIIDCEGNIASFGAIIKNDSGSSGGGRGAATKKLSYEGVAIKVSTDGYIEVFVEGNLRYSIK